MVRSSMRPAVVVMRHVTAQGVPWTPPEIQAVIVFGLGQTRAQLLGTESGGHIPGLDGFPPLPIEDTDIAPLDLGLLGNGIFDIAQLDPETTDLHLEVTASEKFDIAIG